MFEAEQGCVGSLFRVNESRGRVVWIATGLHRVTLVNITGRCSPSQSASLVLPALAVVVLAGQAVQAAVSPPVDHSPAAHFVQAPPAVPSRAHCMSLMAHVTPCLRCA
jgi:hypothetical protein